jgi:hypothetical protein
MPYKRGLFMKLDSLSVLRGTRHFKTNGLHRQLQRDRKHDYGRSATRSKREAKSTARGSDTRKLSIRVLLSEVRC